MTPERLREIAAAAKGHWGYDPRLVDEWAASIDFPPEKHVLETDGGWASVIVDGALCRLEDLWVEPVAMGRGVGRELFERAAEYGRAAGCARMEWEADPNAAGFYEKLGATYVRDSEPSEWGRVLAVMGVSLGG